MFERYTEKARRVIFFARYEASQFGSPYIETEHLLLGLLREDKALTNRFLRSHTSIESIRKKVEGHAVVREKVSTSVDLPLSDESKRVLAFGAEEAERLGHKHIGTEHLLLGLLREKKCFAAEVLKDHAVKIEAVREELVKVPHESESRTPSGPASLTHFFRDLTQAGAEGNLEPAIGRGTEVDAVIEVLAGNESRNPILVGERGAGKRTIVNALAQRIADTAAPQCLANKRILLFEPQFVPGSTKDQIQLLNQLNENLTTVVESRDAILFLRDLRTSLTRGPLFPQSLDVERLRPALSEGRIQCIAACTPKEYEELNRSVRSIDDLFSAVYVRAFSEEETIEVLKAHKLRLERITELSFDDQALDYAAKSSSRYLPDYALPGKALKLLDAAATRVRLRQTALPEDIVEVQKRIKFIMHRAENAIASHEFEKARFYSEEEKKERENLRVLRERHNTDDVVSNVVGPEAVEAVITRWSEYPFQP